MTLGVAGSSPVDSSVVSTLCPGSSVARAPQPSGWGGRWFKSSSGLCRGSSGWSERRVPFSGTEVGGSSPSRGTMEKLYVIVRADLPPGAQVAQACHGLRAFSSHYPDIDRRWYATSNNLVVLGAPDETNLAEIVGRAKEAEIPVSVFREPDFNDSITAIALAPEGARLVSTLPLALRP